MSTLVSLQKFSRPLSEKTHRALRTRVSVLESMSYSVRGHRKPPFDPTRPIITIIIVIYDGNQHYVFETIRSVLEQDYQNVEVILIDNGTSGEIHEFLIHTAAANTKTKIIDCEQHFYAPDRPDMQDPIPCLWNAGLLASEGQFVFFLSCDDILSQNYASEMVRLFEENAACTSAAPRVLVIDSDGNVKEDKTHELDLKNRRRRYSHGCELSRSYMNGGDQIRSPGGLLAHRVSEVLASGGFDVCNDQTQLLKIAVAGESGYEPTASLYWRHHDMQANRQQKSQGLIYFDNYNGLFDRYEMESRLTEACGKEFALEVRHYFSRLAWEIAADSLLDSIRDYGFKSGLRAARRTFHECPLRVALALQAVWLKAVPMRFLKNHTPGLYSWLKGFRDSRLSGT